jgi:hypothetical protein
LGSVIDLAENKDVVNDRQKWFLERIRQKGEAGRAEYVRMFRNQFSITTLYWDLRRLREWGLVQMKRRGRHTYYWLKDESELEAALKPWPER